VIPIRKVSERERNPKPKRSRHDSESFPSAQKQLLRAQWHLERVENEVISEFCGKQGGFTEDIWLLEEQYYSWENVAPRVLWRAGWIHRRGYSSAQRARL